MKKTTKHIQDELGVSGATIANWLKTGIIPPYPNGTHFEESAFEDVIERIKTSFCKLQKRANRSNNESQQANSSAITCAQTREIIYKLGDIFQKSKISLDTFMCGLSIYFLFQRGLIYLHKNKIKSSNIKFSKFISNWINNEHKKIAPLFCSIR